MKKTIEIKPTEAGMRLDRWVKANHPEITFVFLQKLLRKGGIKVDGKKAKPGQKLERGQKVEIIEFEQREGGARTKYKPPIPPELIEELKKSVIYKDENVLVINKPPGLAAQGGTKVKYSVDAALDHLKFGSDERPKLVHRIDKDTSGIMLLARSYKAAAALARMFKEKKIKKIYWALTSGVPENHSGKITAPLLAKKSNGRIEKTGVDEEGKSAVTNYKVKDKAGKIAFLELEPVTGRMHQIRVHLDYIDCPVLGDGKYGGREAFIEGLENRMHLHARHLKVDSLFGKRIDVTAPLPKHMKDSFKLLGFEEEK